jgi:hypothetical protein
MVTAEASTKLMIPGAPIPIYTSYLRQGFTIVNISPYIDSTVTSIYLMNFIDIGDAPGGNVYVKVSTDIDYHYAKVNGRAASSWFNWSE